MMRFFAYLLECADGTLYSGSTRDLLRRVALHNAGRGAKYTRARLPVKLVWSATFSTLSAAMKREAANKKLSRAAKLRLIGR